MQEQSEFGFCVSVLKQGELGSYRDLTQKTNRARNHGITLKLAQLASKIR